jgi:hypothetical protein
MQAIEIDSQKDLSLKTEKQITQDYLVKNEYRFVSQQ